MKKIGVIIALIIVVIGCKKKELVVADIPFKFGINNAEPNLVAEEGRLSLSWINSIRGKEATLWFSQLNQNQWKAPTKIASGKDWFVNWADFPANATNGNLLLTSHLKKSASGTYTYDILLNLQKLNGEIIKENFLLNTDGEQAEHGFVSIIPNTNDGFLITWLDGRNTIKEVKESNHKAMTIRTAEISNTGNIYNETEIDGRTCDCCQTSITMTQLGPMIVYRDRSKHEIRDIYYSLKNDSVWSAPKPVFNDEWKINGCPVNGPKVISNKKNTAVAWFTAATEKPLVKISFFDVNSFQNPIVLNEVNAIGRVDAAFVNEDEVLVSYMESDDSGTYLRCKKVAKKGTVSKAITVSEINSGRKTGVPQLEVLDGFAYFVWTISIDDKNQLKSVKIDLNSI
mgnify:FL=1